MKINLKTGLIITTYNQPELLDFVLETAFRQKVAPYEIIVADDGSKEETERVVRKAAKSSPVTIKHIWQQDQGFRLNHSRNNAIAIAESDYLSLIDGDCFIDDWFIHDHSCFARPGRYIAGARLDVDKKLRPQILQTRDSKIKAFDIGVRKKIHYMRSLPLAKLMSGYRSKPTSGSYWGFRALGANLAFFRDDAIRVNGFNELFIYYGDDDQEFCVRLERNGIKRFKLLHYATAYHFMHDVRHGVVGEDKKLTPTNPEYLKSLDKTQKRCLDTFGLTRALSQISAPIEVEGNYRKYVF